MYSALFVCLAVMPVVLLAVQEERARASGIGAESDATPSNSRALAVPFVSAVATVGLAFARPDGLVYVFIPVLLVVVLRFRHQLAGSGRYVTFANDVRGRSRDLLRPRLHATGAVALRQAQREGGAGHHSCGGDRTRRRGTDCALGADRLALRRVSSDASRVGARRSRHPRCGCRVPEAVLPVRAQHGDEPVLDRRLRAPLVPDRGRHRRHATPRSAEVRRGADVTLFAIAQFFAIALVVFGVAHPGRLATADSFNRVAFHMVPVAMWYIGARSHCSGHSAERGARLSEAHHPDPVLQRGGHAGDRAGRRFLARCPASTPSSGSSSTTAAPTAPSRSRSSTASTTSFA